MGRRRRGKDVDSGDLEDLEDQEQPTSATMGEAATMSEQLTTKTGKSSLTSTTTSSSLLESYNARYGPQQGVSFDYTEDERDELIPALAWRSYHLPGNTFCQDYAQFFANTHPFFAICCHHPLHPVRWHMRMLQLAGSIVFGLLVTNLIWLFMVYDEQRDADRVVVTLALDPSNATAWSDWVTAYGGDANSTTVDIESNNGATIEVTEGMILLWTVGGFTHAFYDNLIYYITACVCCLPGRPMSSLKSYGNILIVFIVIAVAALSSFLVVFRATLTDNEGINLEELRSAGFSDDQIAPFTGFEDKSSFEFLLSYAVEIAMALFVWNPVVGTVLFVGILGCGRVPVLGGRPYEMKQTQLRKEKREEERLRKERRKEKKAAKKKRKSSRRSGRGKVDPPAGDEDGLRTEPVLMSFPFEDNIEEPEEGGEDQHQEQEDIPHRSPPGTPSSRGSLFIDEYEKDDDCPIEDYELENMEAALDEPQEQSPEPRTPPRSRKKKKKSRKDRKKDRADRT